MTRTVCAAGPHPGVAGTVNYFSVSLHNRSISGKHWDTKYRREEEDDWNRDIARLIDILFRGQLHRISLIFSTLLDHFFLERRSETAPMAQRRRSKNAETETEILKSLPFLYSKSFMLKYLAHTGTILIPSDILICVGNNACSY